MIKATKAVFEYLHGMAFHRMLLMPSVFIILLITIGIIAPEIMLGALLWVIVTLPITGPIGLMIWFVNAWFRYVRSLFLFNQEYTMYEIRIPGSIAKSPKAMEIIFRDINYDASITTFIDRWWKGGVRPVYSFELASIEGKLHFFVRTPKNVCEHLRLAIYAQYPEVEIYEVPDYTSGIEYDPEKMECVGREYRLLKQDAMPIKTYISYELDKIPSKSEQRTDPLSSVFETLADLGPGEQMWLQIITRENREKRRKPGTLFTMEPKAHAEAREEIETIYSHLIEETTPEGFKTKGKSLLRPDQKERVDALTNTLDQFDADVGIRLIYLAKKESYNPTRFGTSMKFIWKAFWSNNLNSLVGRSVLDTGVFDYPWQDFNQIRYRFISRRLLDAFRRRAFFSYPHKHRTFVMTPEELATIYHFPSEETKTPGLMRIESKKSEAPSNLPV